MVQIGFRETCHNLSPDAGEPVTGPHRVTGLGIEPVTRKTARFPHDQDHRVTGGDRFPPLLPIHAVGPMRARDKSLGKTPQPVTRRIQANGTRT